MDFDLKTNEKGNLTIGGVDAVELADQYKTPLYVIDEERIKDNYKRIYNAFSSQYSDFKMYYA
jgi:diaminopimelate decarboxylase